MKTKNIELIQTVIVISFVIGLLALALSGSLGIYSNSLNNSFVAAQSFIYTRFVVFQEFFTIPRDVITLRQRNTQLESEVSKLQGQVVSLQKSVQEGEVLAALVNFSRKNPENSYSAATVIGRDPSPFLRYLIIDKGSNDGIVKGMPVITDQGLVGRIDAVISSASRVQLITDTNAVVNIRLEKAEKDAVMLGSPSGDLSVDLLSQEVIVQPGDVILTSGISGGYPADIIVGQVLSVKKKDSDLFQLATVQPIVDFTKLKLVMVITDFKSINIDPLIPAQ
jgi:rod shape-determining protein MreC